MKISVITLFPQMFESVFNYSIIKRAVDKKLIELNFVNLRDFGLGKQKQVDDTPYGGGNGMVLKVDVVHSAIEKTLEKKYKKNEQKVILLTPHGKKFEQTTALKYSKLKHLIIICGHYEGFDQRVLNYVDEQISVGDFVLTGGEIPAMLLVDSVARLTKGVIKKGSREDESFPMLLEYPHYTKPQNYEGKNVPRVLLSGNHLEIKKWRGKLAYETTKKLRPDLLNSKKD
ncbi:MAG: tRNA (guanosine(37)-N1)-methyltransferase TrmD [Candidatus Levybacteria bacterium RBG_13_35_9]|nr:MAG: tRNA (guanosine(37)-N1)-methyltransferase TrmD [Candidatus Levybacteria bacterium RBG_13_35_9]